MVSKARKDQITKAFLSTALLFVFGGCVFVSAQKVPTCVGSQLSLITGEPDAAMGGQRGLFLDFKNTSRRTCSLSGTPGFELLDKHGRSIGRLQKSKSGDKKDSVTLRPGQEASFEIGYHSCEYANETHDRDPKRCKVSSKARFRAPGVERVFTIQLQIDPEDDSVEVLPLTRKE